MLLRRSVALLLLLGCEGRPAGAPRGTALIYRDVYLRHNDIQGQHEIPDRLRVIMGRLKESGLDRRMDLIAPPPADLEWITKVHTPAYVDRIRESCRGLKDGNAILDRPDVSVTSRSFDVAVCAVGGALGAADAVMEGRARNAFCAIRPPGHHASVNSAMGFCLFNNAAITARYLQIKHRVPRIMIIDWDCHHGNGTQDIFYEDGTVFYFSMHQSPGYPHSGSRAQTGRGAGAGCILNVPLPPKTEDAAAFRAMEENLRPAAEAFKPDFILISAGFDAVKGDLVGGLAYSPEGYAAMTRLVKEIADRYCKGRIVSLLEGGYSLKRLPDAVEAHVRALLE
jgi:acetoin utilization deacetylase AcuC-like enzyme